MGNCTIFYDELRFDVRDPEATHVYVFIRAEGDCPFNLHGWHHKAFPKDIPTHALYSHIWNDDKSDPITWEREAPRPVNTPAIYHPHDRVPVPVEQLEAWRDSFTAWDTTVSGEMAEQITSHLTSVTQWDKACPQCRAHAAMLQAQMAPRE
jgi:hypothetical protein